MGDPTYSLAWPRELFVWEARRVLDLPSHGLVERAVPLLLLEAFVDPDVALQPNSWDAPATGAVWLSSLLASPSKLLPYVAPVYWSERHGLAETTEDVLRVPFATDFVGLIGDMQECGYFPRALPRECVDYGPDNGEVARMIRGATKLSIEWPIPDPETLPEGAVLSLIEYFNDQAQRPRTAQNHDFAECGPHYSSHNRESGGAVYRWRVNELLRAHGMGLQLGSTGNERGRLIRHFDSPLDDLADGEVHERQSDPEDEVAHAIRDFRQRGAGITQKRRALALLAGALEPRRKAIGARVTKNDESDLFLIANRFAIRHRNPEQRTDFGEEYLDWIFWNYLAMVQLMERIESRDV